MSRLTKTAFSLQANAKFLKQFQLGYQEPDASDDENIRFVNFCQVYGCDSLVVNLTDSQCRGTGFDPTQLELTKPASRLVFRSRQNNTSQGLMDEPLRRESGKNYTGCRTVFFVMSCNGMVQHTVDVWYMTVSQLIPHQMISSFSYEYFELQPDRLGSDACQICCQHLQEYVVFYSFKTYSGVSRRTHRLF